MRGSEEWWRLMGSEERTIGVQSSGVISFGLANLVAHAASASALSRAARIDHTAVTLPLRSGKNPTVTLPLRAARIEA